MTENAPKPTRPRDNLTGRKSVLTEAQIEQCRELAREGNSLRAIANWLEETHGIKMHPGGIGHHVRDEMNERKAAMREAALTELSDKAGSVYETLLTRIQRTSAELDRVEAEKLTCSDLTSNKYKALSVAAHKLDQALSGYLKTYIQSFGTADAKSNDKTTADKEKKAENSMLEKLGSMLENRNRLRVVASATAAKSQEIEEYTETIDRARSVVERSDTGTDS